MNCLWKRRERLREWQHERCRPVYGEGVKFDVESDWSREDVVSMARLRSGHSLELHGHRCRIALESDGLCQRCGLEPESVATLSLTGASEVRVEPEPESSGANEERKGLSAGKCFV